MRSRARRGRKHRRQHVCSQDTDAYVSAAQQVLCAFWEVLDVLIASHKTLWKKIHNMRQLKILWKRERDTLEETNRKLWRKCQVKRRRRRKRAVRVALSSQMSLTAGKRQHEDTKRAEQTDDEKLEKGNFLMWARN